MGENINDGKIYFKTNESDELKKIELMNSTFSYPTPVVIDDIAVIDEGRVSLEFECNIRSCSRKRFIKLLMGDLFQRNEAERIARDYFKNHGYYSYLGAVLMGAIKREEKEC